MYEHTNGDTVANEFSGYRLLLHFSGLKRLANLTRGILHITEREKVLLPMNEFYAWLPVLDHVHSTTFMSDMYAFVRSMLLGESRLEIKMKFN